jgi:hypothetical protein
MDIGSGWALATLLRQHHFPRRADLAPR